MVASPSRLKIVAPPRPRPARAHLHLGPFIGREGFLAKIAASLEDGARLLTVLGPPGIGKTRAAQQVLEQRGPAYEKEGGAWFVDLSEVDHARGLAHAVASLWREVDAAELPDDYSDALVSERLASSGATLLVLDNFEQLLSGASPESGAASIVRRWCLESPDLRVLVTSRERLAIEGESVVELEPLACPVDGDSAADVLQCEAVRFFVARAKAAGADVEAEPDALGELVRQLDGIPLAIELAAARARVLPPKELTARLKERFTLLAGSRARQIPARHATLESAIDWSWNLLSAPEQAALAGCSVFATGFTVRAAEQILERDSPNGQSVIECLWALRDKSLLHSTGEEGRLGLYLSIREYASRRLEERGADAVDRVRLRHALHYSDIARHFSQTRTFEGTEPDARLRAALFASKEDLIAATAFLCERESKRPVEPTALAELAISLVLLQAAPLGLCLEALSAALRGLDAAPSESATLRMKLLLMRKRVLWYVGRREESRQDMRAARALDGLPPGICALGLLEEGVQLRHESSFRLALEKHEEVERILAPLDISRLTAINFACMGRLHADLGNAPLARRWNGRALSTARQLGDEWLAALPHANLGQLEQELGNFDAAQERFVVALAQFRNSREPQYESIYSAAYGHLHFELGRAAEARRCYAAAAGDFAGWLSTWNALQLFAAWGALEAQYGELGQADLHFDRARRLAASDDTPTGRLILELHQTLLHLRALREAKDASELTRATALAEARVRALEDEGGADHDDIACSLDVRFALRILKKALHSKEPCGPVERILCVARDAAWFSTTGRATVDLSRRGSLRRILSALVAQHRCASGAALVQASLVASGWPGERLLTEAASMRLRVAIATLRRLGLRDILVTHDDGYLLDPSVRVETHPNAAEISQSFTSELRRSHYGSGT